MPKSDRERAAEIVRDSGGIIVGKTKLQKIAYLLELAGLSEGFRFSYRHFGPYSDQLANAIQVADAFGLVTEEERRANWGGTYSIFTLGTEMRSPIDKHRAIFAEAACKIDSVELELAATAAYLGNVEGYKDPWGETARRKPEKAAGGRLDGAKEAYRRLLEIPTPRHLPTLGLR